MAATPLQPAKRSFVSELFAFARQYLVRDVVVEINCDSPEKMFWVPSKQSHARSTCAVCMKLYK